VLNKRLTGRQQPQLSYNNTDDRPNDLGDYTLNKKKEKINTISFL